MSSEIAVFRWAEENETLRAGVLPDGTPYVIAADVCRVADVANVSHALSRLDDDEKGDIAISDTTGRKQLLKYVTEAGFYHLILSFRLRKEHPAYDRLKRFKRWVLHEVLPTIRKTGTYSLPGAAPLPSDPVMAALETATKIRQQQIQHEERLNRVEGKLAQLESSRERGGFREGDAGTDGARWFTLAFYARSKGIVFEPGESALEGKIITQMCIRAMIEPRRIPDEKYGHLNIYPEHILDRWAEVYYKKYQPLLRVAPAHSRESEAY